MQIMVECVPSSRLTICANNTDNTEFPLNPTDVLRMRLYELQSDGTLKQYDFNSNTFKTTACTTAYVTMTHRTTQSGANDTLVFTYQLTTLSGFTAGRSYIAKVQNHDSGESEQAHRFTYLQTDAALSIAADGIAATSIASAALTSAKFASGALAAASFAADCDVYEAQVAMNRDATAAADEWTVVFLKNGEKFTGTVTSPTLAVTKRADGSSLFSATALTQVGSTGFYKLDRTGANRILVGETYLVDVAATIGGSARALAALTWRDG